MNGEFKIKIAHYTPNKLHQLFCKYLPDIEFINNTCDADCDLIYCGSASCLPDAFAASVKFRKPIVCWVWDIPYNWRDWPGEFGGDGVDRDGSVNRMISLLKHCDKILCGSIWTQNILKDKYKLNSICLDWYIDTEFIDNMEFITHEKDQVMQIGRIVPHKRFELPVIAMVNQKTLLISCGRNSDALYLTALIKKFSKASWWIDAPRFQLIQELQQSKALISASVFEGLGLPPIEALYCGTPVILSDIPIYKEMYGENVVYFKKNDVNSLKMQINMLLNDEDLQKEMVKRGRNRIKGFTPELFAQRWRKEVLNNG